MSKMTKREYEKTKQEIAEARRKLEAQEIALTESIEASGHISDDTLEKFNQLDDAFWNLQKQEEALDRRWSRRNWTDADYTSWELVTDNVD